MLKTKQQNKRRKLYHFNQLVNDFMYHDFSYGTFTKDNIKFNGYLYALDNPDMDKLKEVNDKYDNVAITTRQYRYAPEIKDTCIFIAQ